MNPAIPDLQMYANLAMTKPSWSELHDDATPCIEGRIPDRTASAAWCPPHVRQPPARTSFARVGGMTSAPGADTWIAALQSGASIQGVAIMILITDTLRARLLANGLQSLNSEDFDPPPVVKLFTPDAGATWLLSEIDPDDHDHAFGLCDLGHGCPELGYVSLTELQSVRGRFGLPVERDLHFAPTKSIGAYAREARFAGRIVA
jgi:hypothetical protein